MKERILHDEYVKRLLEKRKHEVIEIDQINKRNISLGDGLTSPTSNLSTEETRILIEYMEQRNLFNITSEDPARKKVLTLKKFFKMKRNQQVEIYSLCDEMSIYTVGKVSGVGRDHVMLTNLKSRFWIPYQFIDSANVPYGIPNYSNTHQHFLYDNQYREKLLYQFGETVTKRDPIYQLFNEDSIQSSLKRWIGSWVEVRTLSGNREIGNIVNVKKDVLHLKIWKKNIEVNVKDIAYIETIRLLDVIKKWMNF
ncbi:hypothetical protein [Bacillus sp. AK128]